MTELPAPATSAGEITTHALEIKAGGEPGSFEGYGAVFGNRDSDGDIIQPGAFRASLKARKPVLLWQHDKREPIGVFDVVREDEKGLYVAGRLSAEGKGREAYELLKMGALNGLSIGFVTREANRDSIQGARLITKADLMEVSLVTFPANDLARVSHVKSSSLIEDPRSFEAFLRESGFSRTRAKAITAKGFKGADLTAGESAEIAALVYDLKRRQQAFEGKAVPIAPYVVSLLRRAAVEVGKWLLGGLAYDKLKEMWEDSPEPDYFIKAVELLDQYTKVVDGRRDKQQVIVNGGSSKAISLGTARGFGKVRITITSDANVDFSAKVESIQFKTNYIAPNVPLSARSTYVKSGQTKLEFDINLGEHSASQGWLADMTSSRYRQARRFLERPHFPLVKISYDGAHQGNVAKRAQKFLVTVTPA